MMEKSNTPPPSPDERVMLVNEEERILVLLDVTCLMSD